MPLIMTTPRQSIPSTAARTTLPTSSPQLMPRIRRSLHNETTDRNAADATLAERLSAAMTRGHSMVQVPAGSTLSPALTVYQQLLNQPCVQDWIKSTGLETTSLTVHKDFIQGYVKRDGVYTAVKFTTSDDSGWWQASVKLRGIRELLDPADQGLSYVGDDDHWMPRDVVMQAFGLQAPDSQQDIDLLISRLRTEGLSLSADDLSHRAAALDCVRQAIGDLQEREALADQLSLLAADLPDEGPVDWSEQSVSLSSDSLLPKDDQTARERLQRFTELPQMRELLRQEGADRFDLPFRVSQGKFERLTPVGGWRNLTHYVEGVEPLKREFSALVDVSAPLGNALYSTPRYDMRQLVDFKGLGSPRTAGETRNIIQWLRTALPPAPSLGDYAGLMGLEWAPGQLTEGDKSTLGSLARTRLAGAQSRGFIVLSGKTPQELRTDTAKHLDNLLNSPDALAFGEQLGRAVNWYGASHGGPGLSKEVRQQLVIAAIKLHVDPDMPGKPGEVAGYEIYQPANMGRSLDAVRADIEKHLHEKKGVDPKMAVLAAHVCLGQAAPEFLVRDVPEAVHIGTPAWMELRLGCAMADSQAPGTSRGMNEEQITMLTTLGPTSQAQQTLMQLQGLKIMADWGVLNGVIRERSDGEYSRYDLRDASQAFFKQREEASAAFTKAATPLPTRESLAIKELLRAFPGTTSDELRAMTVQIADVQVRRNMAVSEPRTRSIIETYMTGDLTPGKWVLTRDVPILQGRPAATAMQHYQTPEAPAHKRTELDTLIRRLPKLDGLLETAVNDHRKSLQGAYATKLKLMIAELPLADRQALELGTVELFTLRSETGENAPEETREQRDVARGRQCTLMRVEHNGQVHYYEVFAKGKIIKRGDLPRSLKLNGVIRQESDLRKTDRLIPFHRGGDQPFDFAAYCSGSDPRSGHSSPGVIIERLGVSLSGRVLPSNAMPQTFVPNSYSSQKTSSIANRIAQGNFYETQGSMLERAREPLALEKHREAIAREHGILLGLVPFVGAYQAFAAGDIGNGMASLALDLVGLAIGAGAQARALIRSARALAPNPLTRIIGRLGSSVSPALPKIAWAKPAVAFSDRAFDFVKQTVLFASAAFNPVDGYSAMVKAATKGLLKLPQLITRAAVRLDKVAPYLLTAEEKLRCYWMVAAGQSVSRPKVRAVETVVSQAGEYQGTDTRAARDNGHWYAIDLRSGQPFGTPLAGFAVTASR
ncbi:hypothetical protein HZF02_15355 [Pseudomonas yamanorum]|nr:hypothetical protein HZF02_15355 [Pseudomonas yamanorum]